MANWQLANWPLARKCSRVAQALVPVLASCQLASSQLALIEVLSVEEQ
jgi:hypothetical protein